MSLAVDEGEVVGVAAMSFFRTALDGVETRLAIPVNVATDARYRGQGVFSTLQSRERGGGGRLGLAAHGDLPEREVVSDLHQSARLDRPAAAAAVGAAAAARGVVRYALGRPASAAGCASRTRRRARSTGSTCVRSSGSEPDMDELGRTRRGRLRQPLLARRGVLQLALPRLAARLPLLRRVPERRARRRRSRRPHVQARRLRRVPRRPRRCARATAARFARSSRAPSPR